jgi:hypothetical protein
LFPPWLFSLLKKYNWPLLLLLFPTCCSPHGYSLFKKKYIWPCEEFLHTFTIKICTHKKNPVGSGTTM